MKAFRNILIDINIDDIKKIEQLPNGGVDIYYIDYDSGETLSCETKKYGTIKELLEHLANTRIDIEETKNEN